MTDTVKPMRARRFARPLNTEPRIGCEARPAIPEPSTSELTAPAPPAAKPVSKIARILVLLQREEGATLNEMVAATSWLPHTTRAAMTGLKRKGHTITSVKVDGIRRYRAAAPR